MVFLPRFLRLMVLAFAAGIGLARAAAPMAVDWKLTTGRFAAGQFIGVEGQPTPQVDGTLTYTQFNGHSDGYFIQDNPVAGMKTFTIEMKIRADLDGATEPRFLNINDVAGGRITMELRQVPDGRWALDVFFLQKPSRIQLMDVTKLHPGGVWHWVAMTYDGKTMISYIDGQKELSADGELKPMDKGEMSLGVRLNRIFWFKGGIAEFKATPRALAPAELAHD